MITVRHTLKHSLSQEAVRDQACNAFEFYSAAYPQFSPTMIWVGLNTSGAALVTFTVLTLPLRSTWTFLPGKIEIEVQVPELLTAWKDRALAVIIKESERWLKT